MDRMPAIHTHFQVSTNREKKSMIHFVAHFSLLFLEGVHIVAYQYEIMYENIFRRQDTNKKKDHHIHAIVFELYSSFFPSLFKSHSRSRWSEQ